MAQCPVPRYAESSFEAVRDRCYHRTPFIVHGVIRQLLGRDVVTLDELEERYGDSPLGAVVGLPRDRSPYLSWSSNHRDFMTVGEGLARARAGDAVAMAQISTSTFFDLLPVHHPGSNFWVGNVCSGMHWDNADNFLVQLDGTRTVTLASTRYGVELSPLLDNISKSSLPPQDMAPGSKTAPAGVELWHGVLRPGDALFIPRRWWHCLSTEEVSLAVNIWHGAALSRADRLYQIVRLGPRYWFRVGLDFVCAALGKRPPNRVFSPVATGTQLYDDLSRALSARFSTMAPALRMRG